MTAKQYCPIIAVCGWLGLSFLAPGAELLQTNRFTLAANETLVSELWLAADSIELFGRAQDDLFLLGVSDTMESDGTNGVVIIGGECQNDVWALGNTIELNGRVQDHARLVARTVMVRGSIGRGAMLMGAAVHLTRSAQLEGDALLMGENLIAEGSVKGQLTMIGQNVTLAGTFASNVHVIAQDIVVLPETRITGDLVYRSATELILDQKTGLGGRLVREPLPASTTSGFFNQLQSLVVQAWLFAAAIIVGAIFFRFFPQVGRGAVNLLAASFWKCLLVGFIVLALSPMFCFFAAISLVGLPLSFLIMMAMIMLIYLSKLVVALFVGRMVLLRRPNIHFAWTFLLGLLLLYIGTGAGAAGIIVWLVVVCAGMGSLVLQLLGLKQPAVIPSGSAPTDSAR